jgi:hypothetical protein
MTLPKPLKPNQPGAYKLSANGYSVTLPNTISSDDEPIEGKSYFEEVDGRDTYFSIRSPNLLGRSIDLTGVIFDSVTVRNLRRVLSFKRVTVERGNLINVMDVQNVDIVETILNKVWTIEVNLASPVFYWSSKTLIKPTGNQALFVYDGTVSTPPIFTVLAPTGGLELAEFEINGRTAIFTAASGSPIPATKHLVIDCGNLTAVTEDGSYTGLMNDGFFLNTPVLIPGGNIVKVKINNTEFYPENLIWTDTEEILFGGEEIFVVPFVDDFEVAFTARYL